MNRKYLAAAAAGLLVVVGCSSTPTPEPVWTNEIARAIYLGASKVGFYILIIGVMNAICRK